MDYLGDQGLISKAKSILSSLCGILLWVSKLQPSPVHSPKDFPTHNCDLQLGFKTLIYLEARSPRDPTHFLHIVHSYMISSASSYSSELPSISPSLLRSTSSNSSSSLSSIMLDDLIGTESGVYLSSNEDEIKGLKKSNGRQHDHKPNQRYRAAGTRSNHYPPPIPLLAQTGNLPGRMPWVLTRHYGDGKLIIEVERVKHHEYLEAHRENGRLILNLVPLDEVESEEEMINHDDEELEPEDLHDHFEDKETDHGKSMHDDQEVEIQYQEPGVGYDGSYPHVDDDNEIVAEEDLMITSLASTIPVKIWLENGIMISSSTTTTERSENLRKCFTNNADVFINPNAMLISTNAFAHA
ncbi:hypothetical protein I3760_05G228900 [Carya illinoinensis]|uniref:FAF domain-containing protein n=2 Tax=Carya illinoinensis TaxID=32201 RepID=A0A8T1QLE0_CARIL|nr:hypothetical protein I3760_05G228900 [Carya illinoinensis]KAG6655670.1 hypothetical protein CIPAW_05G232100 [Carya illinoinensis]